MANAMSPKTQLSILLAAMLLQSFASDPSLASSSLFFSFDLFPLVNVTFLNEASHCVDLVCNFDEDNHTMGSLRPGETVSWTVRDVLFPLVWCYVEIDEANFGVFWGYQAKLRCFHHCDWRIRDDGLWLNHAVDGDEERMWLAVYGGTF